MRRTTVRHGRATAFAELPRIALPAQRTTLLRLGLGAALAATLAAAVISARSAGSGRAAVLPQGATTGVVAIDLSASIAGPVYRRVATMIDGIVAANQAVGLVMFSDVPYELLPPNSPAGALLQFARFFHPVRIIHGTPVFGQSPWDLFSGGTRISKGLREARLSLQRAHVKHGAILLVSDLDDSSADQEPLVAEALRLRRAHIPVRIVPLFADPSNVATFEALFGQDALVDPKAFTHRGGRRVESLAAASAWTLLALGAVLVALLALNERLNARLEPEAAL